MLGFTGSPIDIRRGRDKASSGRPPAAQISRRASAERSQPSTSGHRRTGQLQSAAVIDVHRGHAVEALIEGVSTTTVCRAIARPRFFRETASALKPRPVRLGWRHGGSAQAFDRCPRSRPVRLRHHADDAPVPALAPGAGKTKTAGYGPMFATSDRLLGSSYGGGVLQFPRPPLGIVHGSRINGFVFALLLTQINPRAAGVAYK
jgi:hypothetical protein